MVISARGRGNCGPVRISRSYRRALAFSLNLTFVTNQRLPGVAGKIFLTRRYVEPVDYISLSKLTLYSCPFPRCAPFFPSDAVV